MTSTICNGFLLTKQSQDISTGIKITLWVKTAEGPYKLEILGEQAVFFVEQEKAALATSLLSKRKVDVNKIVPLALTTFGQQPVSGFYFDYMHDFYAARECLSLQNIKCYEDDFRPEDRYLMERFITAGVGFVGDKINAKNHVAQVNKYRRLTQVKCKPQSSDVKLSVVSIDIECSMDGDLYSIAMYSDNLKRIFMIGDEQAYDYQALGLNNGSIVWLNDEKALLHCFIDWLSNEDPDILIGWNVVNFDMMLLQKRCDKYGIKFSVGRDGSAPYWRKNKTTEQSYMDISGRVVLDGIDLLKTATYNFPSFSLDNVAQSLLGLGKKVDDVEHRMDEITDNFNHNKPALAAYNLEDCRLVWLIFEKTQLLEFAMLRSQLTGLSIDRFGGSVAAFTNLYLPKLHRSGYVAPNMGDGESGLVSPGGYVMDSVPGLYDNVLVLDFKSLYPSIIRTFKIDPMGLVEGLLSDKGHAQTQHKSGLSEINIPGYDGAYFSRDKHFLPEIITGLWAERDKAKTDKNAALSQAIKIIMNSFYGVLGSTGCRFFDPRLASSITKRSHDLLKTTSHWIEQKGYQVIYGDTDSIFVHVGKSYTDEESRIIGEDLQNLVNKKWQGVIAEKYQLSSYLEIEFETLFTRFLMPKTRGANFESALSVGTKKRYAGIVEKEGEPALIFKGMETVRSDWTHLSKVFQQKLYQKVFNNEAVDDYVLSIVKRTLNGEFDDQLVYRKRIRRRLKDYVKNVPPHVKAARIADAINEAKNKPLKYQNKSWIEYVITLNGPQPIEYISSPLDYDFYVDRQLKTVANDILPYVGTSFEKIVDSQMDLF